MNRTNKNKRTDVCKIYFAIVSETIIEDYPGDNIRVSPSSWQEINYAEASLKESEAINGEMIEQEISIKITGSTSEVVSKMKEFTGKHLLIRFDFSGGEKKVIGTDENPVSLALETEGHPLTQNLTCKRLSSERSKYLIE